MAGRPSSKAHRHPDAPPGQPSTTPWASVGGPQPPGQAQPLQWSPLRPFPLPVQDPPCPSLGVRRWLAGSLWETLPFLPVVCVQEPTGPAPSRPPAKQSGASSGRKVWDDGFNTLNQNMTGTAHARHSRFWKAPSPTLCLTEDCVSACLR